MPRRQHRRSTIKLAATGATHTLTVGTEGQCSPATRVELVQNPMPPPSHAASQLPPNLLYTGGRVRTYDRFLDVYGSTIDMPKLPAAKPLPQLYP